MFNPSPQISEHDDGSLESQLYSGSTRQDDEHLKILLYFI